MAQDDIVNTLNGYNLPSTGTPGTKWKIIAGEDITKTITVPGKTPILLKLGGKYDNTGNLDYNIVTIYP